jgi:GTPase SAR1 family protein
MGGKLSHNDLAADSEVETASRAKTEKKDPGIPQVLMLGAGECGKSTLYKQMTIAHGEGYSKDREINHGYSSAIKESCFEAARMIVASISSEFSDDPQMQLMTEEARNAAECLVATKNATEKPSAPLKTLWADDSFKRALWKSKHFALHSKDSIAYFFDNFDRIFSSDYDPNDEDMLRMRLRTTGLLWQEFQMKDIKFRLHDNGGQRCERRKWIHAFEKATVVTVVVAISDYDEVCFEDSSTNRLQESLDIFSYSVNCRLLYHTYFLLVFTKIDLFEKKFSQVPLKKYFPDFAGSTLEDGYEFIKNKFLQTIESRGGSTEVREVSVHFVNGIDAESSNLFFDSLYQFIKKEPLELNPLDWK